MLKPLHRVGMGVLKFLFCNCGSNYSPSQSNKTQHTLSNGEFYYMAQQMNEWTRTTLCSKLTNQVIKLAPEQKVAINIYPMMYYTMNFRLTYHDNQNSAVIKFYNPLIRIINEAFNKVYLRSYPFVKGTTEYDAPLNKIQCSILLYT